jgi:hypothetical protein
MLYWRKSILAAFAAIILSFVSAHTVFSQISCGDVNYDNPKYHENMDELAKRAALPDDYWDRYHALVVSSLCNGDIREVDRLIDNGSVKAREAQGIAKVLGKTYKAKERSETGKGYGSSRKRFTEMGACSACADNIAQHYTRNPGSACGKLAKQALEGNPEAIKKLTAFPDYCKWKY